MGVEMSWRRCWVLVWEGAIASTANCGRGSCVVLPSLAIDINLTRLEESFVYQQSYTQLDDPRPNIDHLDHSAGESSLPFARTPPHIIETVKREESTSGSVHGGR